MRAFAEYPMMLTHPETREQKLARSSAERTRIEALGYVASPDRRDAFEDAQAVPYRLGETVEEWPRWIDGVLVDPRPRAPTFQAYPKALTPPHGGAQVIVQDEAEEAALVERWTQPEAPAADEAPASDDSAPADDAAPRRRRGN